MVSWKYVHLPSQQVEVDLRKNHGRDTNKSHIQSVSYEVGERILSQDTQISYSHGIDKHLVKSISIGRDGAMMRLKGGQYREAMAGTLRLVGADREVLHTIYVGAGPEYGKASFDLTMTKEITALKVEFGHTPFTAVAAANNWTFLQNYVQTQIIDWWHGWQYIRAAIETIFPQENKTKKQIEKWEKLLQEEPNSILDLLKKYNKRFKKEQTVGVPIHCETLHTAITYIKNHKHQMNYALYLKKGYLIGSGVTESACKTIVKARFCGCGMQWEINNTKPMALMRGLVLIKDRWNQTWKNIANLAA